MAKSSEKVLVKRFCEKNFIEFLARLEKTVGAFVSSPLLRKAQKQDFVNNQALTKRTLIFTLFRKTQNVQSRKQKKIDENGKNLSFMACKLVVLLYIKQ